nr:EamA family transporter [Halomonas socia]
MIESSQGKGVTLVFLATLLWSSAGLFTRLLQLDTLTLVSWRGMVSILVILIIFRSSREIQTLTKRPGNFILSVMLTLATLTYIGALNNATVAVVSIIHAFSPLLAAVIAFILVKERVNKSTWPNLFLALLSIIISVGWGAGGSSHYGIILALSMTLLMASIAVFCRYNHHASLVFSTGISGVQLLVIGVLSGALFNVETQDLSTIVFFGLTQALALIFFIEGARYIKSSTACLVSIADVPMAPLLVAIFFPEPIGIATVIGAVGVMLAVTLESLYSEKRKRC